MRDLPLTELSVIEVADGVRQGRIKAEDVVRAHIDRIAAVDGHLRAFLRVLPDAALERARQVDEAVRRGTDPGPLAGVPVAVKDNICTRGVPTTAASRFLAGFTPPYDATVVERLHDAGAVVVGKTNLDEFAMGSSTENSGFFPTRNPWGEECVPGGSSGGSAAAVAAAEVPAALGTDTGGSIRLPAAFCGVTGVKPTYGRVSRFGAIAFASSLDQIGPMTRSAADAARLLGVLAGRDDRDSTSAPAPVPGYEAALTGDVRGLRVGLPDEYFGEGVEPGVERAVREAADVLRQAGAELVRVSLPYTRYALPVYYLVATAEASSNLARYDGVRYGYRTGQPVSGPGEMIARSRGEALGLEVKFRIMLGTFALSAGYYDHYYGKALQVRRLIKEDFERVLAEVDLLATPTAPTTAFCLGERLHDPLAMYMSDLCTTAVSLAGL
ncbi:MAG TPA: Asp-tRNA(Asn)/Glu-tRNA(Gln) amidotransferase subunit GatA, partial [Bacillota bacterium]